MWIMLTTKLPTAVSPPKMSIFWSVVWPNKEFAQRQAEYALEVEKRRALHQERKRNKRRKVKIEEEELEVLDPKQTIMEEKRG